MKIENDQMGRKQVLEAFTVFASGGRGKEMRANGEGGLLERGYHAFVSGYGFFGPFLNRAGAEKVIYSIHNRSVS